MTLRAGTGVRDISPRDPAFLVGYPHVPRISTGVHDPLLASALCLRNNDTGVLLLAVDLLFLGTPTARAVRRRIAAATGLPEAHIFISCSHTHSGPVTVDYLAWRDDPCVPPANPAYVDFVTEQLVAAAEEAARAPYEAEIAWASANAHGVGGNRLAPDGVTDPEAGLLAVRSTAGAWLALAIIYGMHPTVLHEDSTFISADFPAYTRQHLREALGEISVLYHNAPCGNQSPRYAVQGQTFAEAERLGRLLGARLREALPATFSSDVSLAGALATISTEPRMLPRLAEAEAALRTRVDEFKQLHDSGAAHGPLRTAECAVFGAEETVTLARAQSDGSLAKLHAAYANADVQVLRIGERALAGWPCEIFTEYALELKHRAPLPIHAVCLVNGELQGYIVTPEAMQTGGYEAANSLFTPATGTRLLEATLALCEKGALS